jgi:Lipocalin-like domain
MRIPKAFALTLVGVALGMTRPADAQPLNQVLGTWRMISAQIDPDGRNVPAYGPAPNGLLVFTADMHFVEVLTDPRIPRFASNSRGQGTAAENAAAMAGSIGFFGTYTVDEKGEFSGNRVEGSTFPNWGGDVRTNDELRLVVEGDRMTENFIRPEGTRIVIAWQRVR